MKDLHSAYTNDDLWLIKETKWVKFLQNIRESQFALGNGYLGTRGILEEIPYDAMPGTYIAGIYDKTAAQVTKLVNLPNPFNFRFTVRGEKMCMVAMDVLSHKRILNMKKALLMRHTVYRDVGKRCYDYQSLRLVSMHDKHIGAMQIAITALDSACEIDIDTGINTSVYNGGVLSEGRKRHFRLREVDQAKNAGYLAVETLERKHVIIYWSGFYYQTDGKKNFTKSNFFKLKLRKNQTAVFTKIFYVQDFPVDNKLSKYKNQACRKFCKIFSSNFEDILKKHISSWAKVWQKADILIEGTANLQQNLRFNIYHMLICANEDDGFSSIGARTLSGEGYRGHIFWDTEIFLMPFYLFIFPEVARNILLYRYKRIDAAREIAKRGGYKGAQFPWESADTGEDETPDWARDIDGSVIKIYTHKMEYHITADIAYAVYAYYVVTADGKFMEDYGYEIMFEAARFWKSRLEFNKRKKKYEIRHVVGPDEFHVDVNNNAYTNIMAKWNLVTAYRLFYKIKKSAPLIYQRLKRKIDLKEKEVSQWRKVASQIPVNVRKDKVIEQFDGFGKLKKVILTKTDENGIPFLPPKLKTRDVGKTQLVKQADVLMFLHLLSDTFNLKTKKANYSFYSPRTVHKSSLSPSIHSIIASECGDLNRAYNLFNVALRADISNIYGNTKEGIHAACLGGTWQAVIFGFAGVSINKGKLFVDPRMPRSWGKMVFSLSWRGNLVKFKLTNAAIDLRIVSRKKQKLEIGIFNKKTILKTNKAYTFKRKSVLSAFGSGYY